MQWHCASQFQGQLYMFLNCGQRLRGILLINITFVYQHCYSFMPVSRGCMTSFNGSLGKLSRSMEAVKAQGSYKMELEVGPETKVVPLL